MADQRPQFMVEKLKGTYKRLVHSWKPKLDTKGKPMQNEKGKTIMERAKEEVDTPAGFMVYTSKGDTLHVTTYEELKRLGFHTDPSVVDMETGEVIENPVMNLKSHAIRRAGVSHDFDAA